MPSFMGPPPCISIYGSMIPYPGIDGKGSALRGGYIALVRRILAAGGLIC